MKIPASHRRHGFTLVELLVVIAIIAVLAAAGFAAGNAAIQKAKKVTALASATAIESAVNNFFTEYGSMPSDGTGTPVLKTDSKEGVTLLKELLGDKSAVLNTRLVKFLSVREGKAKKGGLMYDSANTPTGLYDPWGGPFNVMLDLAYEEKLSIPATVQSGGKTLNGRRVAVWSLGADYDEDNKPGDDVITW